jgi:hypothetical protein
MIVKFVDFNQITLTDEAFKAEYQNVYPPIVTADNKALTTGEFIHALQNRIIPVTIRSKYNFVIVRQLMPFTPVDRIKFILKSRVPKEILLTCIDYITTIEDNISLKKIANYGFGSIATVGRLKKEYHLLLATGNFRPVKPSYFLIYEIINSCLVCGLPVKFIEENICICEDEHTFKFSNYNAYKTIFNKLNISFNIKIYNFEKTDDNFTEGVIHEEQNIRDKDILYCRS